MRIVLLALGLLVPCLSHAQSDELDDPMYGSYRTYQEYERAVDRHAARDYARQQSEERLEIEREQLKAQREMNYELNQMRQDQYWRDAEDRQEREHRRRLNILP